MQLSPNFRLRKKYALEHPQARRCNAPGCHRSFDNSSGLTQHQNSSHPGYISEPEVADPSSSTVPVPALNYSSEEEMIVNEGWHDRWSPGEENQSIGCQSPQAGLSDGPQTSNEDEEDKSSNGEDNWAGSSGSRRATVEDVEDEDDVSSASSRNAQSRTSKTYHPLLDGMFTFLSLILITQTS